MHDAILTEILEWSADRPAWQRNALKRLFSKGALVSDDFNELVELCKAAHGLSKPSSPGVLTNSDLRITGGAADAVSLVSVTHHVGVNALAPEQTVAFGPNLTVVYGQNAAGKSGYTRILKRACRARSSEQILGNVLSGEKPLKAQATIRFRAGERETPQQWRPDIPATGELAAVSVFDSHCAPVYLRDKTDVAFRPFSLDIFDKLSAACNEVRTSLEIERSQLTAVAFVVTALPEGTRARALVDGLTSLTDVDSVRTLATLSKDDEGRFKDLRDHQRDLQTADPKERAQELTHAPGS
jgi:hypothetical protein